MPSKTRTSTDYSRSPLAEDVDLDLLSDEEAERLLFLDEEESEPSSWNLPTVAGLMLVLVGITYIFQQMGLLTAIDIGFLVQTLPWIGGIFVALLGLGVISWGGEKTAVHRRKRKDKKRSKRGPSTADTSRSSASNSSTSSARSRLADLKADLAPDLSSLSKRRLRKSKHDKKIAGVCGGIANYFGIDPTIIRIAFVIGLFATQGTFLLAYLALAYILPEEKDTLDDSRSVRIIRD